MKENTSKEETYKKNVNQSDIYPLLVSIFNSNFSKKMICQHCQEKLNLDVIFDHCQ